MNRTIQAIIFDWGDTLMRDFPQYDGAMAFWNHVEPVPGIEEALQKIDAEYTCVVASNAGDSNAELMGVALSRIGIKNSFHFLLTSAELNATKPSLDFFYQILDKVNIEAQACIMVGNDYEKDIVPAKAVGIHTIWYNEATDRKGHFPAADFIIHSMDELYEVILRFEK